MSRGVAPSVSCREPIWTRTEAPFLKLTAWRPAGETHISANATCAPDPHVPEPALTSGFPVPTSTHLSLRDSLGQGQQSGQARCFHAWFLTPGHTAAQSLLCQWDHVTSPAYHKQEKGKIAKSHPFELLLSLHIAGVGGHHTVTTGQPAPRGAWLLREGGTSDVKPLRFRPLCDHLQMRR